MVRIQLYKREEGNQGSAKREKVGTGSSMGRRNDIGNFQGAIKHKGTAIGRIMRGNGGGTKRKEKITTLYGKMGASKRKRLGNKKEEGCRNEIRRIKGTRGVGSNKNLGKQEQQGGNGMLCKVEN